MDRGKGAEWEARAAAAAALNRRSRSNTGAPARNRPPAAAPAAPLDKVHLPTDARPLSTSHIARHALDHQSLSRPPLPPSPVCPAAPPSPSRHPARCLLHPHSRAPLPAHPPVLASEPRVRHQIVPRGGHALFRLAVPPNLISRADPIHASAASPTPRRGAPTPQPHAPTRALPVLLPSQMQMRTYVGATLQIAQRARIWEIWTLLNARATGRNLSPSAPRRSLPHPEDPLSDRRSASLDSIVRASVPLAPSLRAPSRTLPPPPRRPRSQTTRSPRATTHARPAYNSAHALFHAFLVETRPGLMPCRASCQHVCITHVALRMCLNCALNAQQIPNGDGVRVSSSLCRASFQRRYPCDARHDAEACF